jgi:vacuolar protein sorting-associated protein 54
MYDQQARSFLVSYHAIRLTQSAKLVEEEIWTQIDVPSIPQHAVNLLIESAVSDPPECRFPPSATHTNGDTGLSKVLSVEDKTFFVVKATAESLVLLKDYLGIVINLELVVTDVMARIIEFLKVGLKEISRLVPWC